MRLRMLIELLVALILTFAAIVAISTMAKASGMKVETAYARGTVGEAKTGAVYMTLNNVGSEPNKASFCRNGRCQARGRDKIDSPYSDARRELLVDWSEYTEVRRQSSTSSV